MTNNKYRSYLLKYSYIFINVFNKLLINAMCSVMLITMNLISQLCSTTTSSFSVMSEFTECRDKSRPKHTDLHNVLINIGATCHHGINEVQHEMWELVDYNCTLNVNDMGDFDGNHKLCVNAKCRQQISP